MNKLYINNYEYESEKTNKETKISMFADFHFSEEVKKETLDLILNQTSQEKTDFICVPGDI